MKSNEFLKGYMAGWNEASNALFSGLNGDHPKKATAALAHAGSKPRGRPRKHPKKAARRGRPPKGSTQTT